MGFPWTLDFDKTLGFPGEGPRPQKFPLSDRPALDLVGTRGLPAGTLSRRQTCVLLFVKWLATKKTSFDSVAGLGSWALAHSLAKYGQHCYDTGVALGDYVDAINGVVDLDRTLRRKLTPAWDVVEAWRSVAPATNHVPCPSSLALAMFSLATAWGWWDVGILILLGFLGILRPGEMLRLRPADILPPSVLLLPTLTAYVSIRDPKQKRTTARREHVLVEDAAFVAFLEEWLACHGAPTRKIFKGKASDFRKCFDALVRFFGIEPCDGKGITPASLRGGGATWLFQQTGSIELPRWRGRWQQVRTVEIYVQEVAALSVLPALSIPQRFRIRQFAGSAPVILEQATANLRLLRLHLSVSVPVGLRNPPSTPLYPP